MNIKNLLRNAVALIVLISLMFSAALADEDDELTLLELIGDSSFVLSPSYSASPSAAPQATPYELPVPSATVTSNVTSTDTPLPSATQPLPSADIPAATDPAEYLEKDGSVVITLTSGGDFFPGSSMQKPGSLFSTESEKYGDDLNFIMSNMKETLLDDDVSIINFDGVLANTGEGISAAPLGFENVLVNNGIDVVSLESEHTMNNPYIEETKTLFQSAGIPYAGFGETAVVNVKGVNIGLLSFSCIDRYPEVTEILPDAIAKAKETCQIVIVYFHWGNDGWYKPTDNQEKLGHFAVDSGADLVLGSHSQKIQPIECYNGVYICYSLGNFCMISDDKPRDMTSFLFQTKFRVLDGNVSNEGFRIIPIRISSRSERNDFIPTLLNSPSSIDGMVTTMNENAKKLDFPVAEYPTEWK